jgi:hypothetical protein
MPESGKRMETRNDITARLEVQRHCSITKPVVALLPLQVNPNWTMGAAAAWPLWAVWWMEWAADGGVKRRDRGRRGAALGWKVRPGLACKWEWSSGFWK